MINKKNYQSKISPEARAIF